MGSSFDILISILFFDLFFISSFTCARYNMDHFPSKRLIASSKLFFQDDITNLQNNSLVVYTPKIVEHEFKFPFLPADFDASVEDLRHHAGYHKLKHTEGAMMFYFFFESRHDKNDPVVIWLNGGPGSSSSIGLFYENGPFHITNDLNLIWNEYGWDKVSNIIYVDQPTGTGFSYTTNNDDIRHDTISVADDLYDFLQEFFHAHNDFASNEFFITGESFAGHYAPALATRILRGNREKEGIRINLKGFAIGNGLTNPGIQYLELPNYALRHELITDNDYHFLEEKMLRNCEISSKNCDLGIEGACKTALSHCDAIFKRILKNAREKKGHDINYYDIRLEPRNPLMMYDFSKLESFLNMQSVREVLGVKKRFLYHNYTVRSKMMEDYMKSYDVQIPDLLENGMKVLIYVGEQDLICNWLGNLKWLEEMKWKYQTDFVGASTDPYEVDDIKIGSKKSHGNLTFIKVSDAGHLVPMDQPKPALYMIKDWLRGDLQR